MGAFSPSGEPTGTMGEGDDGLLGVPKYQKHHIVNTRQKRKNNAIILKEFLRVEFLFRLFRR